MGIYDREYYRDGSRGSIWLSSIAPACKTIIIINISVYFAQLFFPKLLVLDWFDGDSRLVFEKFQIWRLVTSAFLHDPTHLQHLVFNMLILWFVGRDVEEIYGSREFVFMYLTAGVVSTLFWCLTDYFGPGIGPPGKVIGASGAVYAVAVINTMFYPTREVFFLFILPMPMWLLLTLYIGQDLYYMLLQVKGVHLQRIAFAGHVGGAAFGFLYKYFDLRWSRLSFPLARSRRPRFRVVSPDLIDEVPPRSGTFARPSGSTPSTGTARQSVASAVVVREDELEERLDEILAKIAREGRDHLTEEENRILQEASARARDRRRERI